MKSTDKLRIARTLYWVNPHDLIILPCNPVDRTDTKGKTFRDFKKHIGEREQIQPITVTQEGWIVADGNRRTMVARELGKDVLADFVPGDAPEIFGVLNYWRKSLTGRSRLEAILKSIESAPKPVRHQIEKIVAAIGWDGLRILHAHGGSLSTCNEANKIIPKLQPELTPLDVVLWTAVQKMNSHIRYIDEELRYGTRDRNELIDMMKKDLLRHGLVAGT